MKIPMMRPASVRLFTAFATALDDHIQNAVAQSEVGDFNVPIGRRQDIEVEQAHGSQRVVRFETRHSNDVTPLRQSGLAAAQDVFGPALTDDR